NCGLVEPQPPASGLRPPVSGLQDPRRSVLGTGQYRCALVKVDDDPTAPSGASCSSSDTPLECAGPYKIGADSTSPLLASAQYPALRTCAVSFARNPARRRAP